MKNKRITITGGKGFLGKQLIKAFQDRGYQKITVADLPEYNLVDLKNVKRLYTETKPDIVVHLAAKVGGIGFNRENPGTLFYENIMMGVQLIHEGYLQGIEKFVALGTICAYPKFTPVPFKEDDIWNGYPEETNAPYGLAKKMMLVQSQAYREQYGFNSIFLLPVNLYGPNDNFSFKSSHVIPALIRKFYLANLLSQGKYDLIIKDFLRNGDNKALIGEAKIEIDKNTSKEDILTLLEYYGIKQDHQNVEHVASNIEQSVSVEIWGTGKATREFFYVEDAAQAIVAATEKYDKSEPVNIGAGFEISIRDLTELIVELTDYRGKVARNYNQPDGQPRRMLDTTRAYEEFGFRSKTDFRDGLKTTIAWYADFSKNIVIES